MIKKHLLIIAIALLLPISLLAQRPEIVSGDIKSLIGVEKVNVKFDFSEWTFYEEKMTEKEYVAKRMKDIAADKGDAEAEKWHKDWINTRDHEIINKFINGINDGFKKQINFGIYEDAKYTLIVKVEWIYPGYFAVAMNQPAKATTTMLFIESSNPDKVLLKVHEEEARGPEGYLGPSANTNNRISDVFTTTGKYVGKYLRKKLKRAKR